MTFSSNPNALLTSVAIAILSLVVAMAAVMWDNAIEIMQDHEHRITKLEEQAKQ